jgi:hypothetical protein
VKAAGVTALVLPFSYRPLTCVDAPLRCIISHRFTKLKFRPLFPEAKYLSSAMSILQHIACQPFIIHCLCLSNRCLCIEWTQRISGTRLRTLRIFVRWSRFASREAPWTNNESESEGRWVAATDATQRESASNIGVNPFILQPPASNSRRRLLSRRFVVISGSRCDGFHPTQTHSGQATENVHQHGRRYLPAELMRTRTFDNDQQDEELIHGACIPSGRLFESIRGGSMVV